MSDQDFNFRPQPPRREVKPFEPPPWEKEQFERLAKERATQEAAQQAAAEAMIERLQQEVETAPGQTTGTEMPVAAVEEEVARVSTPLNGAEDAGPKAALPRAGAAQTGGQVDEARLAEMMMGLRAEEPPELTGAWAVALGSAIVLAAVGIVLLIWGIVALTRPNMGPIGTMGGMVLLAFGLIFMGACVWLGLRTLRQRGVL